MAGVLSERSESCDGGGFEAARNESRINAYHNEHNHKGVINLGRGENQLCGDIMVRKFSEPGMQLMTPDLFMCGPTYYGNKSLRYTLANFLNTHRQAVSKYKAENIVITNGVGAAFNLLAHVIAEEGDCFLVPSPYYGSIMKDMGSRNGVTCISVPVTEKVTDLQNETTGVTHFRPSVEKLELALNSSRKAGKSVVGLLIINPHNPSGDVYSKQLVEDILQFAAQEKLHVICDEIFALSEFRGSISPGVCSIDTLPDPSRTHAFWGLSKAFPMTGFRVGVLHSWNNEVITRIRPLMCYGSVPHIIQERLCSMFNDKDWLKNVYFPTNLTRNKESCDIVSKWLSTKGIPHEVPRAGGSIWADFTKYICPLTDEHQLELVTMMLRHGVYAEPSHNYAAGPGFFRIVFTLPPDKLHLGLSRMADALSEFSKQSTSNGHYE